MRWFYIATRGRTFLQQNHGIISMSWLYYKAKCNVHGRTVFQMYAMGKIAMKPFMWRKAFWCTLTPCSFIRRTQEALQKRLWPGRGSRQKGFARRYSRWSCLGPALRVLFGLLSFCFCFCFSPKWLLLMMLGYHQLDSGRSSLAA